MLEFLVLQYPGSVKEKDYQGKHPLHYSCENIAPLEVVKFLVQQYPYSFKEIDYQEKLPLHYACERSSPLQVLNFLVQQYPLPLICPMTAG